MEIKVVVYINGQNVPHDELHNYEIHSPTIDRIVNDIMKRSSVDPRKPEEENSSAPSEE